MEYSSHESDCPTGFFLVGARKAGTTALHDYLGQHPGLFAGDMKEPNYFAYPDIHDLYPSVPCANTWDAYTSLYAAATPEQICGDFSPSYLSNSRSAARIAEARPDAKILIMLRDPVERAISQYLFLRHKRLLNAPLIDILEGANGNHARDYLRIVVEGEYAPHIHVFKQAFPENQILIELYEDFNTDADATISRVLDFLGLDKRAKIGCSQRRNCYRGRRLRALAPVIKFLRLGPLARKLPRGARGLAERVAYTNRKPTLTAERAWLQDYYTPQLPSIAEASGKQLHQWATFQAAQGEEHDTSLRADSPSPSAVEQHGRESVSGLESP